MIKRDKNLSWSQDDKYFKEMLDKGREQQKLVINKLKVYGVENITDTIDYSFRKDISESTKYSKNDKDILIEGRIFEIKSRDIKFTSPEDWPKSYWPMFLDTVKSFDQKIEKPVGYIFISQKTGALMATSVSKKNEWTTDKKWDHKRKIYDNFYFVDKKNVFDEKELVRKLKNLKTEIF